MVSTRQQTCSRTAESAVARPAVVHACYSYSHLLLRAAFADVSNLVGVNNRNALGKDAGKV